jgi:1,5-anhydro-D-fructose reductase (1,5-anhydro-D-mannitol-forming)
MKQVRWGFIGCGDVTEVKSGPAFQQIPGSSIVAVMRRDGEKAADYARRHGIPRWYDDADRLIHDSEVDAVYIATPPGSHLEYGLRVCAAGKPAYIEKPLARNYDECRQLVDAFAAKRLPLFVAYYRRRLPRFEQARQIIESGRLGTIVNISYRYEVPPVEFDPQHLPWRYDVERSGGGLFFDVGCHVLDMFDHWLGALTSVSGNCANRAGDYTVEDAVAMSFETKSGIPGAATWNFAGTDPTDHIEISGTQGKLTLAAFADEPLRVFANGAWQSQSIPHPKHVHQPLVQTIVDELLNNGSATSTCPSTGITATRTAAVMDQVVKNFYRTRDGEFWKRPLK